MHVLWMLKRNMNSLSGGFISLCWKHSKPCYWKLLSPFKCACARVCMCVPNHALSFEDSRLKSAHWDVSNFAFLFCTDQFWSPPSAQRGTTALGSEAPIPARGSPGRNSNPGCLCLAGCWKCVYFNWPRGQGLSSEPLVAHKGKLACFLSFCFANQ